jgi:hypothetical protein
MVGDEVIETGKANEEKLIGLGDMQANCFVEVDDAEVL